MPILNHPTKGKFDSAFVNNHWTFAIEPGVYMGLHQKIGFQSLVSTSVEFEPEML